MIKNISKLFLGLTLITVSCSLNSSGDISGNIKGDLYMNKFFQFQIKIDKDWSVLPRNEIEKLLQINQKGLSQENSAMKHTLEASNQTTTNLLNLFKYRWDSVVGFNPSLVIISEKIYPSSNINSENAYINSQLSNMESEEMIHFRYDSVFTKENLGGRMFTKCDAFYVNPYIQPIEQIYYVTIFNGYALNIICSCNYGSEKQKQELTEMIKYTI